MSEHDMDFENREAADSENFPVKAVCGKCVFHEDMQTYGKPCIQRGVSASDEACKRFRFNLRRLKRSNIDALLDSIGKFQETGISVNDFMLLAGSYRSARYLGFAFGERVWYSVSEKKDAESMHDGRVVGATDGKLIIINEKGYQPAIPLHMVMSQKEYAKLEPNLKINQRRFALLHQLRDHYEPPEPKEKKKEKAKVKAHVPEKVSKPTRLLNSKSRSVKIRG